VQPRVTGQNLEEAAGSRVFDVYGLDVLTQEFSPSSNPAASPMAAGRTTALFCGVQAGVAYHAFALSRPVCFFVIRRRFSAMQLFQIGQSNRIQRFYQAISHLFPDTPRATAILH
jgi:hypothetical protein